MQEVSRLTERVRRKQKMEKSLFPLFPAKSAPERVGHPLLSLRTGRPKGRATRRGQAILVIPGVGCGSVRIYLRGGVSVVVPSLTLRTGSGVGHDRAPKLVPNSEQHLGPQTSRPGSSGPPPHFCGPPATLGCVGHPPFCVSGVSFCGCTIEKRMTVRTVNHKEDRSRLLVNVGFAGNVNAQCTAA